MELVAGEKVVRERITKVASREVRRSGAIAYVGAGALDQLAMGDGDVLVTDCTPESAKAGQTDPSEIERFRKAGVIVHSWRGLHAKVLVLDLHRW